MSKSGNGYGVRATDSVGTMDENVISLHLLGVELYGRKASPPTRFDDNVASFQLNFQQEHIKVGKHNNDRCARPSHPFPTLHSFCRGNIPVTSIVVPIKGYVSYVVVKFMRG